MSRLERDPPREQSGAAESSTQQSRIPIVLHALLPLGVVALWMPSLRAVHLREMSDLGLASVLPWPVYALLAVLTVSFALSLRPSRSGTLVPLVHVVVLVVMLYAITALLEADPRFASTYKHVGVTDFIGRTGTVDPHIDAYFNWPGFFALGALIRDAAGLDNLLSIAAWAPLFFNLVLLPPLYAIFRWASDGDRRVVWLALFAFYATNWVAQDYFSPQAIAFVCWVGIAALLLRWFVPGHERALAGMSIGIAVRNLWSSTRNGIRRATATESHASPQHAGVLLLIVAIFAATVTGHQLTPVPAILAVIGLVIVAGLQPRRLPIIMIVILAAWISYMTTAYLEGHISELLKPVGSVGTNVSEGVGGRIKGSDEHALVVNLRVAGSLAIWLLAGLGFLRRIRHRHLDRALLVLAAAPLALPILQPYGGEVFLRVFLFALPAVAFFIAAFVFPAGDRARSWASTIIVVLLVGGLLAVFQVMRYGNERLDYFTPGDAAAVTALYRLAPPHATLVAGTENVPWRYRDYVTYHYGFITNLDSWTKSRNPDPAAVLLQLRNKYRKTGSWVVITRSMEISAGLLDGRPGALENVIDQLRAAPDVQVMYSTPDGVIFFIPPLA